MLRNARHLESFELRASDGAIGRVTDFFFDDRRWMVRYFVVEAGTWLDHREVLIAPASIHVLGWEQRVLSVDLTRDQVRHSPTIDPEEPVSREQEVALSQYYSWPMYWGGAGFSDPMMLAAPPFLPVSPLRERHARATSTLDEQHHLRSVADVRGYRIEANDGEIGNVDDFLVDDSDWRIGYLIVDTRNWWPGRRVLVAPEWIYEVGWDEAKVFVDLSRNAVKHSPTYDPHAALPAGYTDRLHAHYGQPRRSAEP